MKRMIVIWGSYNSGKARSIKKVYRIFSALKDLDKSLVTELSEPVMINKSDFQATLMYRGKKIGIMSLNDSKSNHGNWLDKLVEANCDIIVCASLESGETDDNVNNIAEEYGYDTVKLVSLLHLEKDKKDDILYDIWSRQIAEGIIGLIDGLINME
jgi:hypothetical protein